MRPERRTARLREYDYSQSGAYAITLCVSARRLAFGKVERGIVRLHPFGQIAYDEWLALSSRYCNITLDDFVVMPNHLHAILLIQNDARIVQEDKAARSSGTAQNCSLSSIIANYKSGVSGRIGQVRGQKTDVWQKRFWDHIIRDERDLHNQRAYIFDNPANWENDELYCS